MKQNVTLVGQKELVAMLVDMEAKAAPALARALYEEGQLAFRQSQMEVPFRFGILKGSGRIYPPAIVGDEVEVILGYGGAAAQYAMVMHEGNHNFQGGKKRRYLQDPVEQRVPGMDQRILKRLEAIVNTHG